MRLQKVGGRQEVTGLVVSERINAPRGYIEDLRNPLYIWDRYGFGVPYSRFVVGYNAAKGHLRRGTPDMVRILRGKLEYLRMVRGEEDSLYLGLRKRYDRLATPLLASDDRVVGEVPLKDFEKQYSTHVLWGK